MASRIGIPRALLYYKFYPFWKTFFQELGVEVVVSERTSRRILHQGMMNSIDEVCLPVKVFSGHVLDLAGKVDAIFIPRIASVERGYFVCAKFLGLPDVIRNCVEGIPPIITVDIDLNRRSLARSMYELGENFTRSRHRIRTAYDKALVSQEEFVRECSLAQSPGELLQLLEGKHRRNQPTIPSRCRIALLGHIYNIHDRYANLNIITRLEKMEVAVVTPDMIPSKITHGEAKEFCPEIYWTYGKEIVGAASWLAKGRVDGIIFLISFGCGPDSLLAELTIRKLRGKVPMMSLILDEETGEPGLMTRLESFVDMVNRR